MTKKKKKIVVFLDHVENDVTDEKMKNRDSSNDNVCTSWQSCKRHAKLPQGE